MDLFRNLFPPNLVEACIMQTVTVLEYPGNDTIPKEEWPFKSIKGGNMNILVGCPLFYKFQGIKELIWAHLDIVPKGLKIEKLTNLH